MSPTALILVTLGFMMGSAVGGKVFLGLILEAVCVSNGVLVAQAESNRIRINVIDFAEYVAIKFMLLYNALLG